MRKLLNTLYVTSEDAYLALKGETADVLFDDGTSKQIPLHTIESIVCFSYKGASPAFMGKCAENGIALSFFTPTGRYLASVGSNVNGNVLLRRAQFRIADDETVALSFAKSFIAGKLYNAKYVLLRCLRDHPLQVDCEKLQSAADAIQNYLSALKDAESAEVLRGIEGNAAAEYFGVFNELILQNKTDFYFEGRSRRPPLDNVNALLSFAYSLLSGDCVSALQSVGLDPYVGFLHTDRPGRRSLALDLIEEFRTVFADRFVLTLINNRVLNASDFEKRENGAVLLKDQGRKKFLSEWQKKKREELCHPFLNEKIPWGLAPYIQALLLARCIRGDLDAYPPFFWK